MQKFAQASGPKVDKDLKQEEKKERDALKAKRKAGLGATAQKQKTRQERLEKKRDEVAAKINGIYKTAQDKVKKKLADLETQSMKRFDDGNAKATKEFEDNVNREHRRLQGRPLLRLLRLGPKGQGLAAGHGRPARGEGDLRSQPCHLRRARSTSWSTTSPPTTSASSRNARTSWRSAKTEIKDYVDKLGPELKDIGKKAADEMNGKLDELDGSSRRRKRSCRSS